MWMCAGFTMLESGSVRTKNASVICLKNIGLYSVAGLTYYLIGYNLMYTDVGSWIGSVTFLYGPLGGRVGLVVRRRSGKGIRHQAKLRHDVGLVFSDGLRRHGRLGGFRRPRRTCQTLVIPGFYDHFNGHCLPHRRCLDVGRWMAQPDGVSGFRRLHHRAFDGRLGGLWPGIMVVGPRAGKFRSNGSVKVTPPSNVPLVTLGVLILWFGWLGFNGGSQLALGGVSDAVAMSNVLVNTNLAAASGVVTALLISRPLFGRVDLLIILNGAIGGLVSITAGPDIVTPHWAVIIGALGGLLCARAAPSCWKS